ncbi:hypothetical protein Nepgr_022116 [Nepenthes gracilis]|uniref:J domain-containing protein n=1 Tax=Nepenthes gracilis TaxID=150966 RepID=A0AAD3SZX5_NEPGR|nr:hypothetical protein Nepgr_022116 [Nepenthes gracilis]
MRCDALVSGSTSRLSPRSKRTVLPFQRSIPDYSSSHFSFPIQFPNQPLSLKTRFRSVGTTRAVADDGSVTACSEMTFYELLGIPKTVTLPEIKQAYKQLARKYHPDVSPPDRVEEYTQRFIRVQEAYETLSDPRRRAMYDRDMSRGLHLAFSGRKTYKYDEVTEDRSTWKKRWQNQLTELKKRSIYKDAGENLSWGARMRRQIGVQCGYLIDPAPFYPSLTRRDSTRRHIFSCSLRYLQRQPTVFSGFLLLYADSYNAKEI